ncbi:putative nucleoside diphosphate kinase 5 [Ananas comosus]|uniref:Putative nucleoside diphosphate kinase 5 n=1 Tax=Ananas comosus TaxID=4615 RepID=A0A199W6I7_ANACO|nr:putative nucleoside diphosphate kinase 5 [Ananas comosus]
MGRIWASQSALLLRDFLLIFLLFFGYAKLAHNSQICDATERERTLAMIKPDGLLGNYTDKIKTIILESGFGIIKERMVQLDDEKAALFYAEHSGKSFFQSLVKYMTSGPVYVMVLEKPDAVSRWRALIGPTDARKAKPCAGRTRKGIASMVLIRLNRLQGKSHFSSETSLQLLQSMTNFRRLPGGTNSSKKTNRSKRLGYFSGSANDRSMEF